MRNAALLLFATILLGACASAPVGPTVRVASDGVFPPFHSVDWRGRLVGFDIELARATLERAGYHAEFTRADSYAALFEGLLAGEHDLVAATTGITPERKQKYAFTQPYFVTCLAILVRSGPNEPRTPADLVGRSIAASAGTTSARAAHEVDGATVVEMARWRDSLAALRAGEVDAVVIDEFEAVPFARDNNDLELLPEPLDLENYGLVLRPDDTDLRDQLDEAMVSLHVDGTMLRLRKKFGLGRPLTWPVRLPR